MRGNDGARGCSLWGLAVFPMLTNVLLTLFVPGFGATPYIYFILSVLFLLNHLRVSSPKQRLPIAKIVLGLVFLPFYLFRYKGEKSGSGWGPLLVWTALFVLYLSAINLHINTLAVD